MNRHSPHPLSLHVSENHAETEAGRPDGRRRFLVSAAGALAALTLLSACGPPGHAFGRRRNEAIGPPGHRRAHCRGNGRGRGRGHRDCNVDIDIDIDIGD